MADLRDLLRRAAPKPPVFDRGELLHAIRRRRQRRRATFTVGAMSIAIVVTVGIASIGRSERHRIVVSPSSTTTSPSSTSSVPSSTPPPTTATSSPSRATVAPVQTGTMPGKAFVAVGPSLVAIDTHNPTKRQTLTTFPTDAGINWVTVDLLHDRVFFGVTSGCDPGINGTYEIPASGGSRRKISPRGDRVAINPDGTKIAYSVQTDGCGSRDVVIQDLASGVRQTFSGNRSISVGGWSSDGQSLFLWAYDGSSPAVFRFRPFVAGAQLDKSERWDNGIAADTGGGRIAIMDWCSGNTPTCVVGVRTRGEIGTGPDYNFGRDTHASALSIDSSGQWPLMVSGNPPGEAVSFFAAGQWHELATGNAADW